jgi:hypothetical protein
VGDESHLDEMRSAIRGDFERLAERRGEQELMRVDEDDEVELDPVPETENEAPRRSWFAHVFSR